MLISSILRSATLRKLVEAHLLPTSSLGGRGRPPKRASITNEELGITLSKKPIFSRAGVSSAVGKQRDRKRSVTPGAKQRVLLQKGRWVALGRGVKGNAPLASVPRWVVLGRSVKNHASYVSADASAAIGNGGWPADVSSERRRPLINGSSIRHLAWYHASCWSGCRMPQWPWFCRLLSANVDDAQGHQTRLELVDGPITRYARRRLWVGRRCRSGANATRISPCTPDRATLGIISSCSTSMQRKLGRGVSMGRRLGASPFCCCQSAPHRRREKVHQSRCQV